MSRNLARQSYRQLTITSLSLLVGLSVSAGSDAALSATTANTIKGTAPLFVTTGANAVDLTDFKYFGLNYGGTDYYTQAQLNTVLSPLNLSPSTTKPSDLYGSTTPAYPLTLSPLGIPIAAEIIENDGDTLSTPPLAELTTGSVKLGWYYGAGNGTQLSAADLNKSFCALANSGKAPYLKASGGIKLSTTFGDPNTQAYPDTTLGLTTPIRKFSIPLSGGICGALPNKTYNWPNYIGAPEWDTTFGFLPQPAGSDNFPTTGANGLYSDLIIAGVDATTLDWPGYPVATPVIPALTDKGITVKVTNVTATNVTVTLTGSKASTLATGGTATLPAFSGSPANPASFMVQGLQGATPVISYAFGIKRWYIGRDDVIAPRAVGSYSYGSGHPKYPGWVTNNQQSWCANLSGTNYVLSGVRDLTNAVLAGAPVATFPLNSNNFNGYQRRIGGGLLTEWGRMSTYTGSDFSNSNAWTSDTAGAIVFYVGIGNGDITSYTPPPGSVSSLAAVCASRP